MHPERVGSPLRGVGPAGAFLGIKVSIDELTRGVDLRSLRDVPKLNRAGPYGAAQEQAGGAL